MKQSKKQTHLEVTLNQVVGIVSGWAIVYFVFPLFNSLSQAQLASVSTVIFFVASYARSYFLRRVFEARRR